ncbi:MAG: hypothetical protein BMS9Abin37_2957 [Acidobacteriota bacterium]|nr:MAG: hypothetical protein BMS9Abin37_2957 [Acidobacteriota bacterium]
MRRVMLPVVLAVVSLLVSGTAESRERSRRDERRSYDTAIGIGFGIDKVNFDDRTTSRGVTYFTGSVRFNFWENDDNRNRRQRPSRLKGFLEAELGYFSDDELTPFERDLLVGLNAIANVHTGTVDVFFGGGFGYHFFRSPVSSESIDESVELVTDDGAVGANMQFGVDLNFSETVAFFALGRYDILTGDVFDFQTKILGGLRLKF